MAAFVRVELIQEWHPDQKFKYLNVDTILRFEEYKGGTRIITKGESDVSVDFYTSRGPIFFNDDIKVAVSKAGRPEL